MLVKSIDTLPNNNDISRIFYHSFLSVKWYLMNRKPCVICAPSLTKWQAKRSIFLGWTLNANRMNIAEYKHKASVIFPLMYLGSLWISAIAAIGIPQLATGPQKCVLIKYSRVSLLDRSFLIRFILTRFFFSFRFFKELTF